MNNPSNSKPYAKDMNTTEQDDDFFGTPKGRWVYEQCKELEASRAEAYILEAYAFLSVSIMLAVFYQTFAPTPHASSYEVVILASGIVSVVLAVLSNNEFNDLMGKTFSRSDAEAVIRIYEKRNLDQTGKKNYWSLW